MPNKKTFQIKPIKELIIKYKQKGEWIDPFPYPFKQDALEYLSTIDYDSVDGVLFDPPYSPRQLKECYENQGMSLHDTKSSVWSKWKDEIRRVIKPGGLCLSFGWSSQGLGKNRGFKLIEIMLIAHGGNHNDTIITVERKINQNLSNFTLSSAKSRELNTVLTENQDDSPKVCPKCKRKMIKSKASGLWYCPVLTCDYLYGW